MEHCDRCRTALRVSSCSLQPDVRSSSDGEDILGQKGFRGTEVKKDVVSLTFLDLEFASQETKGSVEEVGRTGPYTKMDSVDFFGDFCLCFFLFPFLSSSTRFGTNKIAAKFKCLCLLNGRISELLFHHITFRSGKTRVRAAL